MIIQRLRSQPKKTTPNAIGHNVGNRQPMWVGFLPVLAWGVGREAYYDAVPRSFVPRLSVLAVPNPSRLIDLSGPLTIPRRQISRNGRNNRTGTSRSPGCFS
jgi:hypothetical protein